MSGPGSGRKLVFQPSLPEFRKAVSLFAKGADGKIWEADLALLLELAFGPEHRNERGWESFLNDYEPDNGMVPVEAVLLWIDSGELGEAASCDLRDTTSGAKCQTFTSFCDLVSTFVQFDCDANGVICAKDLRYALRNLTGEETSLHECRKMIQRVDSDGNGVVDLHEFVEMMSCPKVVLRWRSLRR